MGFLRRLLGGDRAGEDAGRPDAEATTDDTGDEVDPDAEEKAYELELLRDEQERLSELTRRQLRYADYAWQPPAQGGPQRADAEDDDRHSDEEVD